MMWGKHFKSMYEGSLIGAGADVFVVMGYVIPHMEKHWRGEELVVVVKLNPKLLAAVIGTTEERMQVAIDYLCAPDPKSTSPDEGGRRLVKVAQFEYRVVNGPKYMAIRDEEDRRIQNREAQQRLRQRRKGTLPPAAPLSGNRPSSPEEAIAYFDGLGFLPSEVRHCHQSFHDRRDKDGNWMWGKAKVADWKPSMFTRMTDDRKGVRVAGDSAASPPPPQLRADPDDAAFNSLIKRSQKLNRPNSPDAPSNPAS